MESCNNKSRMVLGYRSGPFCIPEEDLVSPQMGEKNDSLRSVDVSPSYKPDLFRSVDKEDETCIMEDGSSKRFSVEEVVVRSENKGGNGVWTAVGSHAQPPWSSLFKDNRKDGIKLTKMETNAEGLVFREEDFEEEKDWELCLIGCVGGSFPGLGPLKQVTKKWKGKHRLQVHDSGWIIFQFDKSEEMLDVLFEGPYFINGRPLMLKRMPKYFSFGHEDMHVVPIWVRLVNLPIILWNEKFLSLIGSYLGNPISTDQVTARKGTFNYARLLVEVDISKELPKTIDISLPDRVIQQEVYFEKVPLHCSSCGRIGHTAKGHHLFMQDEKRRRDTNRAGSKKKTFGGNSKPPPIKDDLRIEESNDMVDKDEMRLPDGVQQAGVYLQAHSQENIESFLTQAFKGIGGDDGPEGVPSFPNNCQSEDIVDMQSEMRIDNEIQQQEKFIRVLTKKERRRLSKTLKDHPSKFKDKVARPASQ